LDGENSGGPALGARGTFRRAIALASVQLVAFLINAAKGSPAAGMIGVPDFLNVVTDLTASSTDRVTVYLVLLVFYASMVLMVILLLSALRTRLVPNAGRL
jgi:ABC-type amino acid transport system permease subunit